MLLNLLEYHWAEDIDEALLLMGRPDVKTVPLAGGTHLLGLDDDSIEAVVDLRDLELDHVGEDATSVHIGAMTTLQNMVDAPVLKELATGVLAKAAQASSFRAMYRQKARGRSMRSIERYARYSPPSMQSISVSCAGSRRQSS